MAISNTTLEILVAVKDQATEAFNNINGTLQNSKKAFEEVGMIGTAMLGSVAAVAYKSIKDYSDAEASQKMLEHAVIGVTHATQDQLQATMQLADLLEKKGILDGDNIKMGLAQLSTFGLSNQAVQKLAGSLADLAVNQFGVNASGEQLADSANMIAKALNGQFGVLEKSGIRFTEAQKSIIATGTEMQKVQAIIEGFNQNLKFTNDVALTTTEGQMAKLKVQVGNLSEAIGGALSPALLNLVVAVTPLVQGITTLVSEHPKLTAGILGTVAVSGALLMAISAIGLGVPAVTNGVLSLTVAIKATSTAFMALAANPVFLVIAGLVALGAAIYLIVTHWNQVRTVTTQVWGAISTYLIGIWQGISNTVSSVFNSIKNFFTTVWNDIAGIFKFGIALEVGIISTFLDWLFPSWRQKFDQLKNFITQFWDTVKNIFNLGLQFVHNLWNIEWQLIASILTPYIQNIQKQISFAWDWISKLFTDMSKPISDAWSGMWDGLKNIVSVVWEGIKSMVKENINWIIEKINWFINQANSVASKGAGALHISIPQIPTIPLLAQGGIVTKPTLAVIGEAGPEAVVPLNKAGAGGFGGVTINISGNQFLDERSAEKMGDLIFKRLKMLYNY